MTDREREREPPKTLAEMRAAARRQQGGLYCPYCECRDFRIVRTWWTKDGEKHRALVCRHCGKYEVNVAVTESLRPL